MRVMVLFVGKLNAPFSCRETLGRRQYRGASRVMKGKGYVFGDQYGGRDIVNGSWEGESWERCWIKQFSSDDFEFWVYKGEGNNRFFKGFLEV